VLVITHLAVVAEFLDVEFILGQERPLCHAFVHDLIDCFQVSLLHHLTPAGHRDGRMVIPRQEREVGACFLVCPSSRSQTAYRSGDFFGLSL